MTQAIPPERSTAPHIGMPEYVCVMEADEGSLEHQFTAVNDEQAAGLMEKDFAAARWTLYRITGGERMGVTSYPKE